MIQQEDSQIPNYLDKFIRLLDDLSDRDKKINREGAMLLNKIKDILEMPLNKLITSQNILKEKAFTQTAKVKELELLKKERKVLEMKIDILSKDNERLGQTVEKLQQKV